MLFRQSLKFKDLFWKVMSSCCNTACKQSCCFPSSWKFDLGSLWILGNEVEGLDFQVFDIWINVGILSRFYFVQVWSTFSRCKRLHPQRADGCDQQIIACCIVFPTPRARVGKNKDLPADKKALLIIKKINGWRQCFDHHCKNVIKKAQYDRKPQI